MSHETFSTPREVKEASAANMADAAMTDSRSANRNSATLSKGSALINEPDEHPRSDSPRNAANDELPTSSSPINGPAAPPKSDSLIKGSKPPPISGPLALIDYGMGNLRSVAKALEAAGASVRIVTRPEEIGAAAGLVLPGVGALADCIAALRATGLDRAIRQWIEADRPFLGICLGMQALFDFSEEAPEAVAPTTPAALAETAANAAPAAGQGSPSPVENRTAGLGIFPGCVRRFRLPPEYKVPHMGWNTVRFTQPNSPLVVGLEAEGEAFYFVHSYYCAPSEPSLTLAECDYGGAFTAAIARGNCYATQFHPEKSQVRGLHLYRNFIKTCTEYASK